MLIDAMPETSSEWGLQKKSNKKTVEPDYGISYNQLPKITHHLSIQISKHIISSNQHLILIK